MVHIRPLEDLFFAENYAAQHRVHQRDNAEAHHPCRRERNERASQLDIVDNHCLCVRQGRRYRAGSGRRLRRRRFTIAASKSSSSNPSSGKLSITALGAEPR